MRKLLPLLLLPLIFITCTTDAKRMEMQTDAMLEFMDASGLDFTATGTGLYYHIEKEGDLSRIPDSSHLVSFKHIGYLIDFPDWFKGSKKDLRLQAKVEGLS